MGDAKLRIVIEAEGEQAEKVAAKLNKTLGETGDKAKKGGKEFKLWGLTLTDLKSGFDMVGQALEKVKAAWEFAAQGAELKRVSDEWEATANKIGFSAQGALEEISRMSHGTVDNTSIMLAATRSLTLGTTKSVGDLSGIMEVARAATHKFGGDTTETFKGILKGLDELSPDMLKTIGIIPDNTSAFGDYAKALGKTEDQLTNTEKRQALLNATLEQGQAIIKETAGAQDNAAEKMKRFETRVANAVDDLKEFAVDALTPVLDRTEDWNTIGNGAATATDKLAAAQRLLADPLAGNAEFLRQLIPVLEDNVRLENEHNARVQDAIALGQRIMQTNDEGARAMSSYAVNVATAKQAEDEAAPTKEELAAAQDHLNYRTREAAAANQEARDSAIELGKSYNDAATALINLDKQSIARVAIQGLDKQLADGRLTTQEYYAAVKNVNLEFGLATEKSYAAVDGITSLNGLLASGKISPEEYAEALSHMDRAARDGRVTMEELGIKVAAGGNQAAIAAEQYAALTENVRNLSEVGIPSIPTGPGRAGSTPGFAQGGSFIIGGAPGVDRNLVMFRGSRGEEVTIGQPGEQHGSISNTYQYIINDRLAMKLALEDQRRDRLQQVDTFMG